jgi:Paraquat-inducible protein A
VAFLPPDFYSIDLLVIPKWGLYASMVAQIICQLSSHVIIHYHRRIIHAATNEEDGAPDLVKSSTVLMDDEENEIDRPQSVPDKIHDTAPVAGDDTLDRLCNHGFRRPHRGDSDKLVARRPVGPLLLFLASCLCVLVVVGCVVPSYTVRALGIVGVLVESGQAFHAADTNYSVFTTIKLLFGQARLTGGAADYIGLGSLSVLLVLTVLIVPVVQSLALLVQWFVPLTRKRRYRLSVFLEILQAWQYTEVYLLAILVASWQIGPISGE